METPVRIPWSIFTNFVDDYIEEKRIVLPKENSAQTFESMNQINQSINQSIGMKCSDLCGCDVLVDIIAFYRYHYYNQTFDPYINTLYFPMHISNVYTLETIKCIKTINIYTNSKTNETKL